MNIISIIIATYNAESYLQRCFDSIISQNSQKFNLIIIDAGSTDGTVRIIKNNQKYISYWISEPDKGIYDAWNKGLKVSKGQWVMFLGADDILLSGAIDAYLQFIKHNGQNFDIISAKLDYVDDSGTHLKFIGEPWDWGKFKMSKMSFAHPGLLHNADLFIINGLFDTKYKICGDSDFFLRTRGDLKAGFLDFVTVKMQKGGVSCSVKAIVESYKVRQKNHTISDMKNIYRFLNIFIRFYLSKIKYLCGSNFSVLERIYEIINFEQKNSGKK